MVQGHPKDQASFARCSGYVEQTGVSAAAALRRSLHASAACCLWVARFNPASQSQHPDSLTVLQTYTRRRRRCTRRCCFRRRCGCRRGWALLRCVPLCGRSSAWWRSRIWRTFWLACPASLISKIHTLVRRLRCLFKFPYK